MFFLSKNCLGQAHLRQYHVERSLLLVIEKLLIEKLQLEATKCHLAPSNKHLIITHDSLIIIETGISAPSQTYRHRP